MIRKFISYYKPHKFLFFMDMLCAFLLSGCSLLFPIVTRKAANEYIPDKNIKMLVIASLVLLAAYGLKSALNYFVNYYGHVIGVKMQGQMRQDVFAKLQDLPFSFFDENKTGSIMSRIINDLFDISELAHHGPEDLFISAVLLVGSFIGMAAMNIYLTLIIFAFLPVLVAFSAKKRIQMTNAFTKAREEIAEVHAALENSISGIRISKAFVNRDYETARFAESNKSFIKAREKALRTLAEFSTGNTLIIDLLNVVVLLAGGIFAYLGKITVGDFTAFLIYVSLFLDPIRRLISFIEQYQNAMTGFARFAEIMDSPVETDAPGAAELKDVKGHIEIKNVGFTYGEQKQVLSGINLEIKPGSKVALVGPSGGGKTTLCHLLPRFYEIDAGEIKIDGIDIRNITLASLRKNIGIVQQDVFLFTGTIYENILCGRFDATRAEVEEAAKKANIHDFIISLPDRYDSYIGEHGVKLSGGQKQRIAIARVFLKNPKILILDEATSALDNVTELQVQQSLDLLSEGKTTLVVAHRLSTVRNADEIIVLTDEGIEERGTHDELLNKNGLYAKLYNTQFLRP